MKIQARLKALEELSHQDCQTLHLTGGRVAYIPKQAAAGLGESLLGAKSPQIKTWQSVSTVDAFSHTADTTTWVVYQPSGSPLGVVQVLPTHAGTSSNFMGNVVARCK